MEDVKKFDPSVSDYVSSIIFDILITIITCGIYNLFIQNRQIKAVNHMMQQNKYSFWKWFFFTIITCGIYHIYHEYIMAGDIESAVTEKTPNFQMIMLVLALFGLTIVADAVMQSKINKHFGFEQI